MKIYDREGTPNAARIRIVLAEKGLEDRVEFIAVDLRAAEQKQPDFLAMNPTGKTPVLLLDDGTAISESVAITEYLDNLDGNPVLTGKTALEKGMIHMMHRRVEIMLLDPIDDYFHYGTKGLGPALLPWRMPDWPAAHDWGQQRGRIAIENFPYFDTVLLDRPFLAGDAWSLADITLFAAYIFAKPIGLPIGEGLAALHDWFERFSALPAVRNRSGQTFRKSQETAR
ncbi:MAG: glutathione S-transferase family protein [Sphingobium sp.]